jgi:hypothetical protein
MTEHASPSTLIPEPYVCPFCGFAKSPGQKQCPDCGKFSKEPINNNGQWLDEIEQFGDSLIRSSADFVRYFVPPDYLLDGILQRRFCYALTAKTGAGKTAILLLLAALVALGRALGDRAVERGKVLFLSGENPDDVRMRWIAMAQQMDFDIDTIDVHFISGRYRISAVIETIREELDSIGGVSLVVVDTSTAYFEGDDENNNAQAVAHARMLRGLCDLPGGPCVLVACHPTKNASDDNLLPRGGGAFVNEMDGNLTARKSDSAVEMHWQAKFRGPDFAPLSFHLRTVTHERLKDSKGRSLPQVVASHLSEAAEAEMAKAVRSHEDELLLMLDSHPQASTAELAELLGWRTRDNKPYKMQVHRLLKSLSAAKVKLITKERDGYMLTPKGLKAIGKGKSNDQEHHDA